MEPIATLIENVNWQKVAANMHQKGYALVPGMLSAEQCQTMIDQYDHPNAYRKTVNMERYRFGRGEYKYFKYPLPQMVQALRERIYPKLAPMANQWMQALKLDTYFPETLKGLTNQCHNNDQVKPTPLILKYGKGGFNTLHQDLYGEVYFPIQTVFFLNEPDLDYSGGEFVMTQQSPRAQSKAMVLRPKKGDMLIFTTSFRPVKGTKGYYRANMKHGVSEILGGERHTLGIIFHDATS